jgi:hypothetical protein
MLFPHYGLCRIATLIGLVLVGVLVTACAPIAPTKPITANVTWPEPIPIGAQSFWSNTPSVALIESSELGIRSRVVAGFNDSSGAYERLAKNPAFFREKNPPNLDGVAFSDDYGATWNRPTPFLPHGETSVKLLGNPSVASNGARVIYASLSAPAGDSDNTVRIVAHRSDDAITWSIPSIVADHSDPGDSILSQTVSYAYGTETAALVYTLLRSGKLQGVHIVTSDSDGEFWTVAQPLTLETDNISRAIVRLTNPSRGYLAYTSHGPGVRTLYVASISRDLSSAPAAEPKWTATTLLSVTYKINQQVVARPSSGPDDPGVWWLDQDPVSFEVGNVNAETGSARLYAVYRNNDSDGRSVISFAWCQDLYAVFEACRLPGAWKSGRLRPSRNDSNGQFQPVVAANRSNFDVAISWYEDAGTVGTAGTRVITMFGQRSTSAGIDFAPAINIDPRHWAACPEAESPHSYGRYLSSLMPSGLHLSRVATLVLSLYVNSSGGCVPTWYGLPQPTFDQHVESSQW